MHQSLEVILFSFVFPLHKLLLHHVPRLTSLKLHHKGESDQSDMMTCVECAGGLLAVRHPNIDRDSWDPEHAHEHVPASPLLRHPHHVILRSLLQPSLEVFVFAGCQAVSIDCSQKEGQYQTKQPRPRLWRRKVDSSEGRL